MKVRVTITQKMIDEYRRYNMSPNLFQHYIQDAMFYSESGPYSALSVFVFQQEINITLSPNRTHSFKIPFQDNGVCQGLGLAIIRYYQVRDTVPVDFTLDFRDNSIEVHAIGDDV